MAEVKFEEQINRLAQIVAEDTYSKNNIKEKVREDIISDLDGLKKVYDACISAVLKYLAGSYYESKNKRIECIKHIEPEELVLELFINVIPNNSPTSIQKIVGQFAPWFKYEDIFDGVHTAAEILGACWNCDLYTLIDAADAEDKYINIKSNWRLDDDTLNYIDRARFLDPMLVQPDDWYSNTSGGYITNKTSVILGKHKHHSEHQALDVLNILQKISWSLDEKILAIGEISKKKLNTQDKKQAFERMVYISKKVQKTLLDEGNAFYFNWKLDFRGRMYSDGHYVNFQSNSFRKAQLNFTEKRLTI